ncbi:MAG TPA: hypothetical protein VME23_18770 [Terracidiphilus sp.]|nr:hypothetical protein [Terracidiphilus sp.]
MVVKSKCHGNRVTGLYVGENNARQYFPRGIKSINLQLDHLLIRCGLTARFWDDEPEIHDPRLCLWLESKQAKGSNCRGSMPLYMIPAGEGSFVLGFDNPDANLHPIAAELEDLEFELENLETGAAA